MLHAYQGVVLDTVQHLKKLFIGIVFKISSDRIPSGDLRMKIHTSFDLGGGGSKISKVNLRSFVNHYVLLLIMIFFF